MKVLFCGDRNWTDEALVFAVMQELPTDAIIISGGARGADNMAERSARLQQRPYFIFPAQWDRHGKAAGPIRNCQMLDQKPDQVFAFHNNLDESKGTLHCVTEARKRGIEVQVFKGATE